MDTENTSGQTTIKKIEETIAAPIVTGRSEAVLASLFRSMLLELNISGAKFNSLITNFTNSRSLLNKNVKDNSSEKGNLRRELLSDVLSWKVFCKGLRVLNIVKFDIVINAHHANGKVTVHSKTISFSTNQPIKNDELPFKPE